MKTNREKQAIVGEYVAQDIDDTAIHDVSLLQQRLAVVEPEENGYNPYDNPGRPPAPNDPDELSDKLRALKKIRKNKQI